MYFWASFVVRSLVARFPMSRLLGWNSLLCPSCLVGGLPRSLEGGQYLTIIVSWFIVSLVNPLFSGVLLDH